MDKLPESNIKVENKAIKWLKNYWYYYKWRVIAALFIIVVLAVCVGQSCSNSGTDIKIIYGGTYPSSGSLVPSMEDALSSVIPDEYVNDGSKKASLVMFNYFTDEQITQTEKDNPLVTIDKNNNRQELGKFKDTIVSGDAYLCLVDPSLYELLDEMDLVMPLEEALGYKVDNSVEGKAIRLSDTEFGSYFACFKDLPETYICIRLPGAIQNSTGRGKDSYQFECAVAMLRSIVTYEAPEE